MHKKLYIALLLTFAMLFAAALPSVANGDSIHKQYRDEIKETKQINKYKKRVKRIGDTLYLKTRSGTDAIFKDTPEGISLLYIETHQFMYYLPDHDLYFIKITFYEVDGVLMVSGKTGEKTHIGDLPTISPDKKWLLTVLLGDDMTSKSTINMWRISDGEFAQVLEHEPKDDIYRQFSFVRWQDDKTIVISEFTETTKDLCPDSNFMTIPVFIKLEKDGWKIYEDLSPETAKCGSQ